MTTLTKYLLMHVGRKRKVAMDTQELAWYHKLGVGDLLLNVNNLCKCETRPLHECDGSGQEHDHS